MKYLVFIKKNILFKFQLMDLFINNTHIKYIPVNKMLENMFEHNSGISKFESEKSDLSLKKDKLAADTFKTIKKKENSRVRL